MPPPIARASHGHGCLRARLVRLKIAGPNRAAPIPVSPTGPLRSIAAPNANPAADAITARRRWAMNPISISRQEVTTHAKVVQRIDLRRVILPPERHQAATPDPGCESPQPSEPPATDPAEEDRRKAPRDRRRQPPDQLVRVSRQLFQPGQNPVIQRWFGEINLIVQFRQKPVSPQRHLMADQRTMPLRARQRAASQINTIHEQPDAQHQHQIKPSGSNCFRLHAKVLLQSC